MKNLQFLLLLQNNTYNICHYLQQDNPMKIPDSAERVFEGKTFDVYQWKQEMFDGSMKIFEKLKRNHSVDIVAVSPDGDICIIEEEQPGRAPFLGLV